MYTYYDLLDDVSYLSHNCVETGVIGASENGRLIPYIHTGTKCGAQIIVTGGIHAREHISSLMCIRLVYHFLKSSCGESVTDGGIYFVPMLNPDGNLLIADGVESAPKEKRDFLLRLNGGSGDFSLWKANINGVDLNTNFDARWGKGKHNVFSPAGANYVGPHAFSESETRAIRDFTLKIKPAATISYHALGQELYYEFHQTGADLERDKSIAMSLNSLLNYKLVGDDGTSVGGYKDYCISALKIPAFTIELVSDKFSHPLNNPRILDDDFNRGKDVPVRLLDLVNKYK